MNIQQIDNAVLNWWQAHQNPFLTQNFLNLTALGSTTVIVIFLLVWSFRTDAKRVFVGLLCVLAAFVAVEALKLTIDRPRPQPNNIIIPIPHSPSCPSGHSAMSMAVYMIAAFSTYRKRMVFFAFLLAILVGCSRMYLGVHYFSDVMFGWSIGLIAALLFRWTVPPPEIFKLEDYQPRHYKMTRDSRGFSF
jgi:membrane-associated phospholipid phosphatase